MIGTTIEILYVDKNGMVTFICKKCGESRRESAAKYKEQTGSIKIECKCRNVCEVRLEFRQFFRKKTFLDGVYFRTSHPGDRKKMTVSDLSFSGCRFETSEGCTLVPREEIGVEFVLDDREGSTIKKKAVVIYAQGYHVGCKFSILRGSVDSVLGFYLRTHENLSETGN